MNAISKVKADTQTLKPGIYQGIPNEKYHASPGISKSGLWTIATQSPAHYRFGERKQKNHFDFGEASHLAILQPEEFEKIVVRGPDDRRGNKWKDLVEACEFEKKLLLTSGDFDNVLAVRDVVHANQRISNIITGGEPMIEASGVFIDAATGETCRVRPDLYRKDLAGILDAKSARSAHPDAFARAVVNYGYHAQEAFYTDGWNACLNSVRGKDTYIPATDEDAKQEIKGTSGAVDWFAFLVYEPEPPYAFAVYELPPSIVEEGRAMMRKALDTYAECKKTNTWPGYGEGVQELSFSRWAYRLTQAPTDEGEE